jgi:hypothetical protein
MFLFSAFSSKQCGGNDENKIDTRIVEYPMIFHISYELEKLIKINKSSNFDGNMKESFKVWS